MTDHSTAKTTGKELKDPLRQVGGRVKPPQGRRTLYSYMEGLRLRGLTPDQAAPLAIAFMRENVRRRIAAEELADAR